jgi:hypothetical protein
MKRGVIITSTCYRREKKKGRDMEECKLRIRRKEQRKNCKGGNKK